MRWRLIEYAGGAWMIDGEAVSAAAEEILAACEAGEVSNEPVPGAAECHWRARGEALERLLEALR